MKEFAKWKPHWKIEKYHKGECNPYAIEKFDGNSLLYNGIDEIWKLIGGISNNHFDANNTVLGVGDSTTEVVKTQTDLQGSNKAYANVGSIYPQVNNHYLEYRVTFAAGQAVFAWQEFVIKNNATGIVLNRKVSDHSSKPSDDTWVLSIQVALV